MQTGDAIQLDSNVDDMDPRLWPTVIDALLAVGAHDAWVTPILMKKGRPAHTVSVLCDPSDRDAVLRVLFRETTTLGVREAVIRKHVLERAETFVEVRGHRIGVKVADDAGEPMNRSVEWDDVAAAAAALGLPTKQVLAEAAAAVAELG